NIRYDYLLHSLPVGERILVNDTKPSGLKCAYALNVKRDARLDVTYKMGDAKALDSISLDKDLESALKTIDIEIENLKLLKEGLIKESLDSKQLENYPKASPLSKALDLITSTKGRVVFTGMGKSGIIAKKIVSSLASTGTPSFFIHPSEASHGDLGMLKDKDLVVAISNSGESKELVDVLAYCKKFRLPLISITKNKDSTLGKAGNVVLSLPSGKEACPLNLAPTSSTTATLVLGDILTVRLMERRNFSKAKFENFHPGGKLGFSLLQVSSIMHKDDALPLLHEKASLKDALLEMTLKRLGCVGFVNDLGYLIGILTDGDLRRILNRDFLDKDISLLMTKDPITLAPTTLVATALDLMQAKEITSIFILEDKKPIGVINIHDCLKSCGISDKIGFKDQSLNKDLASTDKTLDKASLNKS
ncbi:KpsF/GutQ family sugar-phosphate isomerase, partial [Helicobacter sp. 11S02629-2]|uniref:KpsF/GutQ family sugar-phosphate isomerase n=1 Tax=Helicobacter sp. 11S02629-2 TaxID=1476195 RepID=UPI000BA59087